MLPPDGWRLGAGLYSPASGPRGVRSDSTTRRTTRAAALPFPPLRWLGGVP